MGKQVIGIGSSANDRTGDKLRVAFDKINDNFSELYAAEANDATGSIVNGNWSLEVDDQEEGYYRLKYQDTTKAVFIIRGNNDLFIGSENGAIKLCANDGPVWELKGDGTTIIPEGARIVCRQLEGNSTGDSYLEAGMGFRMHSGEGCVLEAANVETEQTHYWYFGIDGSSSFPRLQGPSTISGEWCSTLLFPFAEAPALITTKSGEVGYQDPDDLFLFGGDGHTYGQGADVVAISGSGGTRRQVFGDPFTQDVLVTGQYTVSLPWADYNAHSGQYNLNSTVLQINGSYTLTGIETSGENPVILTLSSPIGQAYEGTITVTIDDIAPDYYAGNGGTAVLGAGNGITGGGVYIFGGNAIHPDEIPWCGGTVQINGGNSTHGTGGHVVLTAGTNGQNNFGRQGNIKMQTSRGEVIFGGEPEEGPTAPTHWHIVGQGLDLFFGDDNNYLKLPAVGGLQLGVKDGGHSSVLDISTQGTTTFPGATIYPTDAPTPGGLGNATQIIVTNSPNTQWTNGATGDWGDVNYTVEVDGSGNATVTVNTGGVGHYIGETFTVNGGTFGGGSPADDMNFYVNAIDVPVAIDLTKSIQSLDQGVYSLVDGAEGQVIYFTLTGSNNDPNNVWIIVANQRVSSNNYTDVWWNPFFGGVTNVCTAIFVGGCWQFSSGSWD